MFSHSGIFITTHTEKIQTSQSRGFLLPEIQRGDFSPLTILMLLNGGLAGEVNGRDKVPLYNAIELFISYLPYLTKELDIF